MGIWYVDVWFINPNFNDGNIDAAHMVRVANASSKQDAIQQAEQQIRSDGVEVTRPSTNALPAHLAFPLSHPQ